MKQFKAGDKVYCPIFGVNIFTLSQEDDLLLIGGYAFNQKGEFFNGSNISALFHVTEENCLMLEKLYGVEFEKPPVKPTNKEIIQAMLDRGDKSVCCWVSDVRQATHNDKWSYIVAIDNGYFCDCNGGLRDFATPFDPKTGKAIIDFNSKTGEVILEKEDE